MSFPLILEKIWADYTYSSKKANLSHSRYVLYAWGCVDVFICLQIRCRNRIVFNLFLELQSQKRAADAHDHWCKYISFAVLPGYASAIFNCWWTDCSDISSWSFGLMVDQTEAYSVLITTEQYSWLNEVYVLPSHLSQMGSTQNAASIQCGLKKNVETMNWIVFLHEVNTFASEPSLMKCYSISLALHSSYVLIELDPTRPSLKLGLIDRLVKHSIFKRHNDLK